MARGPHASKARAALRVRKGTAADTATLYPLYKVLRPKDRLSEEDFARLLGAVLEEMTELWIAEAEGAPAGFLTVRFGTTLHSRRCATIEELVVDPGHRRQGVGGLLVDKARERARANGCWTLELATYEEGSKAQKAFYEALGFLSSSTFYRLTID